MRILLEDSDFEIMDLREGQMGVEINPETYVVISIALRCDTYHTNQMSLYTTFPPTMLPSCSSFLLTLPFL